MTLLNFSGLKTKLINYTGLAKKNRPADQRSGVRLAVEQIWPNSYLDFFDKDMRQTYFQKARGKTAAQPQLEGVDLVSDLPSLTNLGVGVETIHWHPEMTGYTFIISRGAGMARNHSLRFEDCVLRGFQLTFQEGGSVKAKYFVEIPAVPPGGAWDTIAELKTREFDSEAIAPVITQGSLESGPMLGAGEPDDKPPKGAARQPGAAERAAMAKAGKTPPAKTPHKAKPPAKAADAAKEEPKGDGKVTPRIEQSQPGTRTARGLAKTKDAIDEGLRQAAADGQTLQ